MIDNIVLCIFTSERLYHITIQDPFTIHPNTHIYLVKKYKNLLNYGTLMKSEKPPIFPIYPIFTLGNHSLAPRVRHLLGSRAQPLQLI